jgi:Type II secretion system (T2SS), protein E, N-terminal domain
MPQCASSHCTATPRWWRVRSPRGATLDGAWLCSLGCVEDVIRTRLRGSPAAPEVLPRLPGIRLGALLRHQRAVSPELIAQALEAQTSSRMRLGEQLRAMGLLEPQALLRALADQAGVSYLPSVDVARVHEAPGGFSRDAIQALRIVPIGRPEDGRIRVAFPAPVPRTELSVFRQQTGWSPEPFLVSDDDWLLLLEHYGRAAKPPAADDLSMGFAREHDLDEGARRLAQVAIATGETRMREARWGPYVWVRLQGEGAGFDLLLDRHPGQAHDQEGAESWQAATTSH